MKSAVFILLLSMLVSENGHSNGLRTAALMLQEVCPATSHIHRANLFRSLTRKIGAVLNVDAVSIKTADNSNIPESMAHYLLDNYRKFGSDVFVTKDGKYHPIEDMPSGDKPFSGFGKHLAQQQHDDGHVFSLRQDGLYYGTYSADQARTIDEYYRFPLRLKGHPDDIHESYYQDLINDMTLLIKVEHVSGNSRTISKAAHRILKGEDLHLLKLLEVRDEVALYENDTLLDVFKSIYIESLKHRGLKDIPKLEEIDARIAKLGLQRSGGSRQHLTFNSHYTWDRTEIAHYLFGETEKLGADSIARLRIMANSDPKLQGVLDELLSVRGMNQTEFEQALTEVSSVFHMLDIDSSFPTRMPIMDKEQQVNKLLKEVAKRKNKVLHQYFDTVVFHWDGYFLTGRNYLDRIRFIEDLILAKKKNTPGRWTVRDALEELGIEVNEYRNYTSRIEGEASLDTLSSIATSIHANIKASAVKEFTNRFLKLHQDVAIVKDVKGAAKIKKIEVVGVEVE